MSDIFRIDSISQIHAMIGRRKPAHPLITLLEPADITMDDLSLMERPVVSSLYSISLKNGRECRIRYGRQMYDFQEGSLIFTAPEQLITPVGKPEENGPEDWKGWVLVFHPDLIRKGQLGKKMGEYGFFQYDSSEALHLSEKERKVITGLACTIKDEFSANPDNFSQELICSNLELLLNYCKRYYARQFLTRADAHKDIVARFETFLHAWFESGKPATEGLPEVRYCAREMGYSPNYLSDLLKKETGKNTREHIQLCLIERAKTLLLGTEESVSQIAYSLGFEYPQHFSKLFKEKTGTTPSAYRQ